MPDANKMNLKKYEWLFEKKWYIQGFNAVPLLINHGGGSIPYTWKAIGYGYDAILNDYVNDFCEMYYDLGSFDFMYGKIMEKLSKNKNYIKDLKIKSKKEVAASYKLIIKIKKLDIKKLSNKDFFALFKKLNDVYPYTVSTNHIIEPFSIKSDERIKDLLLNKLKETGEEKNFSKYLTILTSPTEKSEIYKATQNLFKIINIIKSQKLEKLFNKKTKAIQKGLEKFPKIKKLIENHQKEYFWIASSYAKAKIADMGFFVDEIKRHMKEKDAIKKDSVTKAEKNALIKRLKIEEELLELVNLIDFVTIWQDERKREMLSCCCYIDLFAKEAGRRFKLKHEHVRYLIPAEITEQNLKKLTNEELADRRKGCIVIYTRNGSEIYSGRDYQLFITELRKHEKKDEVDELTGTCASLGKVVGRAKICKTFKDIASFKKGDVLVATMTRPEFVAAMKKAVAIVTDEGGITSHAAIVSRELGIPCIIGTKIATKVLRNNDLLEVAANHSRVRIIEKVR